MIFILLRRLYPLLKGLYPLQLTLVYFPEYPSGNILWFGEYEAELLSTSQATSYHQVR